MRNHQVIDGVALWVDANSSSRWSYEQAQAVAQSRMTSGGNFSKIIHPAVAAEAA